VRKKGEVVGPAGGGTGEPRCLAEVRELLKAALLHYFKRYAKKLTFSKNTVKYKKKYFLGDIAPPYLPNPGKINIQLLVIKCK